MKVVLINGSPNKEGCTYTALREVARGLISEGVESELIWIEAEALQDCIACFRCTDTKTCAFQDNIYKKIAASLEEAEGVVVGSPVYFAGPRGALCSLLDRLLISKGDLIKGKAAAAIATCRRSGGTATLDRLLKYFTYGQTVVAAAQYWPVIHGNTPEEVAEDQEGLQVMRTLGKNMAWIIKSQNKAGVPLPEEEEPLETSFIR